MTSADKSLAFFKIFDLAFFAPGVVIAGTVGWLFRDELAGLRIELGSPVGILFLILGIGAIYVTGLSTFSVTWLIFRQLRKRRSPQEAPAIGRSGWPALALLFQGETQDELILYFWYLRATCLSLATAFLVSSLAVFLSYEKEPMVVLFCLAEVGVATSLAFQGLGYDEGVERSLSSRALAFVAAEAAPSNAEESNGG